MNALITSTASCPSSFQLKFSFNLQKSPLMFFRSRFSELDRRRVNLVWVVVRSSGIHGYGLERRRTQVSSWMNSKSSSEDFSGCANADGELQPGNSRRKQSLVGILGAGAAGFLLVAGLTFTALSISNRTTPRGKQQMEPLTTHKKSHYPLIISKIALERRKVMRKLRYCKVTVKKVKQVNRKMRMWKDLKTRRSGR